MKSTLTDANPKTPFNSLGILALHVSGWAIFLVFPFFLLPPALLQDANMQTLITTRVIGNLPLVGLFYANLHWFTPQLLISHNRLRFGVILVVAFLVALLFTSGLTWFVLAPLKSPTSTGDSAMLVLNQLSRSRIPFSRPFLIGVVMSFSLVVVVSSLLALLAERTRIQLESQQAVVEKVSAELTMLKQQISPHFLFNTLNNISWLARKQSPKAEDAIMELAQLMRYIIYQTDKGPVSLRQEVEHLQHYISLQTMRLSNHTTVNFACTGNADYQMIEPLLFIPFVENAFKHGVHSHKQSFIDIQMAMHTERVSFRVNNPTFASTGSTLTGSGIGIQNARRRLVLHYPGRHQLVINETDGEFRVDLTIQLPETKPNHAQPDFNQTSL